MCCHLFPRPSDLETEGAMNDSDPEKDSWEDRTSIAMVEGFMGNGAHGYACEKVGIQGDRVVSGGFNAAPPVHHG